MLLPYFSIIQSICRLSLSQGNVKLRSQVERLKDHLKNDGYITECEILERLLNADKQSSSLQPSRVELSQNNIIGERLTANVHPPADRETGAPLADIILEDQSAQFLIVEPELENIINEIIQGWEKFNVLEKLNVAPSRSCLLFGSPGTGKTRTAFNIANRLGLPIVNARLDGLVSSFLGTSARNISNLFEFANRYNCILVLDEFDAIAKLRDDPQEVGEIKRIVNTLLQNLDIRSSIGITIAITNNPTLLDPAIWRRFEVRIEMPMPANEQREFLLRSFLAPLPIKESIVQFMVWASHNTTGADIQLMTNAIKRHVALSNEKIEANTIVNALRNYVRTSASLRTHNRLSALRDDPKRLVYDLLHDEEIKFTQSEVASLLGKDQGTISRWLNEMKE